MERVAFSASSPVPVQILEAQLRPFQAESAMLGNRLEGRIRCRPMPIRLTPHSLDAWEFTGKRKREEERVDLRNTTNQRGAQWQSDVAE